DNLSFESQLNWKQKFKGLYADHRVNGEKVYFLKPQTYMNLSGESVQVLAHFFKINVEEILVVHDDLDLPYGQIVFKKGGGAGGNNGVQSIIKHMGSNNFHRMRMGIDRPKNGSASKWVLSAFSKSEEKYLGDYLIAAAQALELALNQGLSKAASQFSRKNFAQ
ncbi:MAG: aminoacyl-tRNA hydrolase, partial [Bacteriovoracia bacterium]